MTISVGFCQAAESDMNNDAVFLALRDSVHHAFNDGDSTRFFPAVKKLEELGVDVLGANCSVTPIDMQGVAKKLLDAATCPVVIQANAGTPEIVDGKPIYTITPESYARDMQPIVDAGVRILGGCCGTNPAFIAELAKLL